MSEPFILRLISKLPEQYQDIIFRGKTYKGKRDPAERYDIFFPFLKPNDVILDVGSSLGYYTHRIAKEFPNSLIVSFESEPEMVEIQKALLKDEGIYNVVICQHRLTGADLGKWIGFADTFDTVLALSVLHHFKEEELASVINAFTTLSPLMIGEIPEVFEEEACGQGSTRKAWGLLGDVEEIGVTKSHLGENSRKLWIKRSEPIRTELDAFFGINHEDRHKFTMKHNMINGKHIIKGLNAWNLLHFNVKWPEPNWWQVQARAAYNCIDKKSDVRPWNLLMTPTGLKAIDFTTEFPKGDKAEFAAWHLTKMNEIFRDMKPGGLY